MSELVRVLFKHLPVGTKFIYQDQEYTKGNHQRGWYHKEGSVILKNFNKKSLVQSDGAYFYNKDYIK